MACFLHVSTGLTRSTAISLIIICSAKLTKACDPGVNLLIACPSVFLTRAVPCCSCGQLTHLPLHFTHWEVTGWGVWRQTYVTHVVSVMHFVFRTGTVAQSALMIDKSRNCVPPFAEILLRCLTVVFFTFRRGCCRHVPHHGWHHSVHYKLHWWEAHWEAKRDPACALTEVRSKINDPIDWDYKTEGTIRGRLLRATVLCLWENRS